MEALAREADVSNPLIYKYFDTRRAVLQELLVSPLSFNSMHYDDR
jgi:AcrR family transcriptional regulator